MRNYYICTYGQELHKYWNTSLSKYELRKNSLLHSMLFLLVSQASAFAPKRGTSWIGMWQWDKGMMLPMHDLSVQSARFKMYRPVVGSGTAVWVAGVVVD